MFNINVLRLPVSVAVLAALACVHTPYGSRVTHADPLFMESVGANERGDAVLRLMLDSLLSNRPHPYCLEGKYLAIRRQVVGPLIGCRVVIADTSVFYYTNPDGRLFMVARRFFVPPEQVQLVRDSVYRQLEALYGPADTCPPGPREPAFQLHTRWIRDGYTLRFIIRNVASRPDLGYDTRAIRNVELQTWSGLSKCEETAGEPGGR